MSISGENSQFDQPLLAQTDLEGAFRADSNATQCVTEDCDVKEMFAEHSSDALRFLQSHGLEKLAEFTESDDIVFRAFKGSPLLTLGSNDRKLAGVAEQTWRQQLREGASKHLRPRRHQGWSRDIGVEAFVVTVRDAAASGRAGLLHPLLEQMRSRRCTYAVFSLPVVQSVVHFKFNTFARRLLLLQVGIYTVWLIAHYAFLIALQGEDLALSLSDLAASLRGRITLASEGVALAAMAPFFALDVGTLKALGWQQAVELPSFRLDIATSGLQLFISVLHLGRFWLASRWLTYAVAVQAILLMVRFQNIVQSLRPSRFSFAAVVREVLMDAAWALVFLLMTCISFGAAMHIAFRNDDKRPEEFESFFRSILTMFERFYGDLPLKLVLDAQDPIFATILALIFIIASGFVLSNLIIGVVIDSLDRVLKDEAAKHVMHQADVATRIESMLPAWFERRFSATWHPKYVHVLRINPHKLDAVDLDALWALHGSDQAVIGKPSGGGGGVAATGRSMSSEVEEEREDEGGEYKAQFDEIKEQLARQEKLLCRLLDGRSKEVAAVATTSSVE